MGLIAGHTSDPTHIMYYRYDIPNEGKNEFTTEEIGNLQLVYRWFK